MVSSRKWSVPEDWSVARSVTQEPPVKVNDLSLKAHTAQNIVWLVVLTILKNMSSSVGIIIANIWKNPLKSIQSL